MAERNEADLVRRCQQGDEGAFRELVEQYKDLVFALVSRSVRDRAHAEDLAQEVFLRVYRGLPYFRGEARLSTWLYRIVVNLCAQERARRGGAEVSLDAPDEQGRLPREPGREDRALGDLELRDRLEKAIRRLPAPYRVLIAGHYLQGVGYEELAEALNMPLGTVKTQLHRAKRRLRYLLETDFR